MIRLLGALMSMDVLHHAAPPSADSLREQWRTASARSTWLRPGDWYHPAVDALVEALCEHRDVAPSAERLGRARGEGGVSIGETLDDVACLYRARGLDPDLELLRAVSVGWVDGYESMPVYPQVYDPESGLATVPYLVHRLREVYGASARSGAALPLAATEGRRHGLLVIDVAVDGLGVWQRVAQSAAMGRALTETFGEGHPMAALGTGEFVALTTRSPDEGDLHAELRARIDRAAEALGVSAILRRPPRIWMEPLPPTHTGAVNLLRDLQR